MDTRARAAEPRYGNRPPTVYVKRISYAVGPDSPVWIVDCPYCRREHQHGPAAGHRVAHCGARPGYVIRLADGQVA